MWRSSHISPESLKWGSERGTYKIGSSEVDGVAGDCAHDLVFQSANRERTNWKYTARNHATGHAAIAATGEDGTTSETGIAFL